MQGNITERDERMFRKKKEKRWEIYKVKMKEIADELELDEWLQELMISTTVKEEQRRPRQELARWMDRWEKEGQLPQDFANEDMLLDIYRNHTEWAEDKAQFHVNIRKADDETFESLIQQVGHPVTSMPLEAQKAYLALWGEILNVVAQTVGYDQTGSSF